LLGGLIMQPQPQEGSKRRWRKWRASERNRYKIEKWAKKRSTRLIRRMSLDEDIPLTHHKKMIHWWDIDKMW
jgi:hypothetical protein